MIAVQNKILYRQGTLKEYLMVIGLHCFRQFLFLICQTDIAFKQGVDT